VAASVGLLVSAMSTNANAAPFGQHSVKSRSVHVLLRTGFNLGPAWTPVLHRRWRPHPPTSTTTTTTTSTTTTTTGPSDNQSYPIGVADASEPSGYAPPPGSAMSGYTQDYVQDFTGSSLPSGWATFSGQPGSDPGAQWSPSHVVLSEGMLQLNAYEDPNYGNEWVTGGVCQCGLGTTYGAYFVRSRVTGAGPTNVELLWPLAHVWPPEIDFNETAGDTDETSATVHFTSSNAEDQRRLYNIDMTQWHTWGVIWTPSQIIYTMDGEVWGTVDVAAEIPNQAMTLDLTQQTWCASGWACPTQPESMQIDWVAEYVPQS
jgi:hypothetical protein